MSHKFEYKQVPLDRIYVDEELQRPEQIRHIKKMAEEWDELLAGTPVVSCRDNGYYHVMDGQHEVKALRMRGETEVWAKVFYGLTRAEEAHVFVGINGRRNAVHNIYKFKVSVQAEYPLQSALEVILAKWGWAVGNSGNGFASVVKLQRVAEGPKGIVAATNVIETITRAWGKDPEGAHQNIIAGLGALYNKRDIDVERMVKYLTQVSPVAIRRDASTLTTGTPAVKHANVMLRHYNKGLREANRIPELVRA